MLFQQPATKQSTKAVTSERITTNICKTTYTFNSSKLKKKRYTTRTCYATTAVKTEIHFMHTHTPKHDYFFYCC